MYILMYTGLAFTFDQGSPRRPTASRCPHLLMYSECTSAVLPPVEVSPIVGQLTLRLRHAKVRLQRNSRLERRDTTRQHLKNKGNHHHPSGSDFSLADSLADVPKTFRLAAPKVLGFCMRSSHSTARRKDVWLYRSYFSSRDQ